VRHLGTFMRSSARLKIDRYCSCYHHRNTRGYVGRATIPCKAEMYRYRA